VAWEFKCWVWQEVLGLGKGGAVEGELRDRGVGGRDGVHMERVWTKKGSWEHFSAG
jgi:hypothetical protein